LTCGIDLSDVKITRPRRFDIRRTNADIIFVNIFCRIDALVYISNPGRSSCKGVTVDNRHSVVNVHVLIYISNVDLIDIYVGNVNAVPAVIAASVYISPGARGTHAT